MQLIIFSGLPGTGKSSIAEAVGRQFGIPVFAKDHLEATLLRSGVFPKKSVKEKLGYAGYELLSMLAERQLFLGQSVILDSVAGFERIRSHWRDIALKHHAQWQVVECICSDEIVHKKRIEKRKRNIPGWHELTWNDLQRVRSYYDPWQENRLVLDATQPMRDNIASAWTYLSVGL